MVSEHQQSNSDIPLVEHPTSTSANQKGSAPLTQGFARNSLFNLFGWAWPMLLSFFALPYIVTSLGESAYGVYAIVSIAAGYLAMMNTPVASGNIRFMAEAYGRGDSDELRQTLVNGLIVNTVIACLGGIALFFLAVPLTRYVFKIPQNLVDVTVIAFRLAAFSYTLNGIASAARSFSAAVRRYDLVNMVTLLAGTTSTLFVVFAVWQGYGLVGAVLGQLLSSFVAVLGFGLTIWLILRTLPAPSLSSHIVHKGRIKELLSFSTLLFGEHVMSQVGLRIDRTLVAIMLGPTFVTYYTVSARITDMVPGIIGIFSTLLYPLVAEAKSTGRIDEIQFLYLRVLRLVLWLSAFLVTLLIVLSKDLLSLWIGNEIAQKSWGVLIVLAVLMLFQAPRGVAFQTALGLGRADFNLILGVGTLLLPTVLVLAFIPQFGLIGAASGMLLGLGLLHLAYEILVRRNLLGQRKWFQLSMPYIRVLITVFVTVVVSLLWKFSALSWPVLALKSIIFSCIYVILGLIFRAAEMSDVLLILNKFRNFERSAA